MKKRKGGQKGERRRTGRRENEDWKERKGGKEEGKLRTGSKGKNGKINIDMDIKHI